MRQINSISMIFVIAVTYPMPCYTKIKSKWYYNTFGSIMPGREYTAQSVAGYRFSFNGQEKDDEIYGEGNITSAEYWQYDSRLGRRWNIDPDVKVHESPYACFANNPIWFSDPNGKDTLVMHRGEGEEYESSKYGTALIYQITFSIIEKGVERTVNTGHDFHMISNKEGDTYVGPDNKDNELTKQPFYQLKFDKMPRHPDWGEAIRVGSDGVFIHRWMTINGWLQGCKGLTTNLQVNPIDGPNTSLEESTNASNLVKALYNANKGNLTGAKFLLKPNSTAPPSFTPINMENKGFGGFNQSTPSGGSAPLTQLTLSPSTNAPKMNRMEKAVSKVKVAVLKATGN